MAPPNVPSRVRFVKNTNRQIDNVPSRVRFQNISPNIDPGMSRAMAGNTGLAGLTTGQVDNIIRGQTNINRFTGNTNVPTYTSVGKQFGEVGSKYRRPADKVAFADDMAMLNKGIGAGGNFFVGPDGIPRFSFTKTGLKDAQGATLLSRQLPQLRATPARSFGETMADVGRAFSGYNSIKYPEGSNIPEMVRTSGMFENFKSPALAILEGVGGFFNDMGQKTSDFNAKLMQLTPAQRRIYDQAIFVPGTTPEQAYNKAIGMAMGGIATLQ